MCIAAAVARSISPTDCSDPAGHGAHFPVNSNFALSIGGKSIEPKSLSQEGDRGKMLQAEKHLRLNVSNKVGRVREGREEKKKERKSFDESNF